MLFRSFNKLISKEETDKTANQTIKTFKYDKTNIINKQFDLDNFFTFYILYKLHLILFQISIISINS